jgi:hypothetical protein
MSNNYGPAVASAHKMAVLHVDHQAKAHFSENSDQIVDLQYNTLTKKVLLLNFPRQNVPA